MSWKCPGIVLEFDVSLCVGTLYYYWLIYRPPNTDVNLFLSALASILEVINSENRSCYLAGDFNIDLLNCKQLHGQSFLDQLFSFGFYPRIDRPTRITDTSATLIDNISTYVHNNELASWSVDSWRIWSLTCLCNYALFEQARFSWTKICVQTNILGG